VEVSWGQLQLFYKFIEQLYACLETWLKMKGLRMNSLLKQFARWAYNVHTRGLDEAFRNRTLMPVDRGVQRYKQGR